MPTRPHLSVLGSRPVLLTLAVIASLAVLLVASALDQTANAAPPYQEPPTYADPELSPEWRWSPPGVQYQQMYRPGSAGPPRIDWIREGRR